MDSKDTQKQFKREQETDLGMLLWQEVGPGKMVPPSYVGGILPGLNLQKEKSRFFYQLVQMWSRKGRSRETEQLSTNTKKQSTKWHLQKNWPMLF